tara:strand:- start:36 stop:782 length:747 start_codon:yes stop_codon:yes gene_type:complete
MTFDKIAQKVPLDKRGKIFTEIWFPTLFHYADIFNYEERNKKWLKHIFKWKDDDNKGIVRSNSRGWHSAVDMHTREEYQDMGKEALDIALKIQEIMDINPECEPVIDNMWANVSDFGAHNRNHTHPGSHFSFVYYLQSPDKCGSIWFSDPRAQAIAVQLPYNSKNQRKRETLNEVYWAPVPGRLIMFPSWAVHEVEPNLSELKGKKGLRVSVSGNLSFRYKEGFKYKEDRKGHDAKGVLTLDGIEKRT